MFKPNQIKTKILSLLYLYTLGSNKSKPGLYAYSSNKLQALCYTAILLSINVAHVDPKWDTYILSARDTHQVFLVAAMKHQVHKQSLHLHPYTREPRIWPKQHLAQDINVKYRGAFIQNHGDLTNS